MFNMLNARKIEDEYNVFAGVFASHVFWVVWVIIIGFQARHRRLGMVACTCCALGGLAGCVWA